MQILNAAASLPHPTPGAGMPMTATDSPALPDDLSPSTSALPAPRSFRQTSSSPPLSAATGHHATAIPALQHSHQRRRSVPPPPAALARPEM